jgi:hydroxymethylpyrimidine pyrophosphatase-like HAD family hydrolase
MDRYCRLWRAQGSTVQKLQEILNVSPAETMAFGDGYNDLELLAQAEYSFAMRNAFEEVKHAARFVTEPTMTVR